MLGAVELDSHAKPRRFEPRSDFGNFRRDRGESGQVSQLTR